jgi:hypothetical protein
MCFKVSVNSLKLYQKIPMYMTLCISAERGLCNFFFSFRLSKEFVTLNGQRTPGLMEGGHISQDSGR